MKNPFSLLFSRSQGTPSEPVQADIQAVEPEVREEAPEEEKNVLVGGDSSRALTVESDVRDVGMLVNELINMLNRDTITPEDFLTSFSGIEAMLIRYRANNFTPWMGKIIAERRVEGGDQDEWEELDPDEPWVKLLRRPSSSMPPSEYYQLMFMLRDGIGHMDSLVIYGDPTELGLIRPVELIPIFPSHGSVRLVTGAMGYPAGWLYFPNGSTKGIPIPYENIIRIKRTHPYAPWLTISLVMQAAHEIDTDLAASIYGRNRMRGRGRPDVVLESERDLNEGEGDKYGKLANRFARQYHNSNRFTVPISHAGLKVKPISLEQAKDFIAHREFTISLLYALMEVHEGLFAKNSTEANAKTAKTSFAENTVQPNIIDVSSQQEFNFERIFDSDPDRFRLKPPNTVPVDRKTQAEIDRLRIFSGVQTPNEVRRREGKDPYENGDNFFLPGSMSTVDNIVEVPLL